MSPAMSVDSFRFFRLTVSIAPRGLPGCLVLAATSSPSVAFSPVASAFTSASVQSSRVTLAQDRRFQISRTVLSAMLNFFASSLLVAVLGRKTPSCERRGREEKISRTAVWDNDARFVTTRKGMASGQDGRTTTGSPDIDQEEWLVQVQVQVQVRKLR